MPRKRRFIVGLLATVAALAVAPTAFAENSYGAKVDDAVAARADAPGSTPLTEVPVVVFGKETAAAARAAHLTYRHLLWRFDGLAGRVKVKHLKTLADHAGVEYVAADAPVHPNGVIDFSDVLASPGLSNFTAVDRARSAWNRGVCGDGSAIAVVDSGVVKSRDFGTRLFRDGYDNGDDTYGHGTFVAHVAAGISDQLSGGRYVGVSPCSSVYSYNVAYGDATYTSDVIAGIQHVLANKERRNIRVLVLALTETTQSSYLANLLDTAVQEVWKAGIVVVVAAGNLGAGSVSYAPANSPHAITVGATDTAGTDDVADDVLASFSSYGTTYDGYAKPELVAPGRRIAAMLPPTSALGRLAPAEAWVEPGYARMSGTSFAAPQVAAAIAMLLQQRPLLTPDEVKWLLTTTARPVAGSNAPALDIEAALAYDGAVERANKGIRPTRFGLRGSTTLEFKGNTWNGNTWNGNTWNGNTWNGNTWNSTSWSGNTWNALSFFGP